MSLRHILAAAGAALLLFSMTGCIVMPGPYKSRLYVSDWTRNREHPVQIATDWKYEGEHWEHTKTVDHKKTPKEREEAGE